MCVDLSRGRSWRTHSFAVMGVRCIALLLACDFVFVGGFVFSPARERLVSAPTTDFKGMGRTMAEQMEKARLQRKSR